LELIRHLLRPDDDRLSRQPRGHLAAKDSVAVQVAQSPTVSRASPFRGLFSWDRSRREGSANRLISGRSTLVRNGTLLDSISQVRSAKPMSPQTTALSVD